MRYSEECRRWRSAASARLGPARAVEIAAPDPGQPDEIDHLVVAELVDRAAEFLGAGVTGELRRERRSPFGKRLGVLAGAGIGLGVELLRPGGDEEHLVGADVELDGFFRAGHGCAPSTNPKR